jgi:hypothetical protein
MIEGGKKDEKKGYEGNRMRGITGEILGFSERATLGGARCANRGEWLFNLFFFFVAVDRQITITTYFQESDLAAAVLFSLRVVRSP